jgi:hypothetical protein
VIPALSLLPAQSLQAKERRARRLRVRAKAAHLGSRLRRVARLKLLGFAAATGAFQVVEAGVLRAVPIVVWPVAAAGDFVVTWSDGLIFCLQVSAIGIFRRLT